MEKGRVLFQDTKNGNITYTKYSSFSGAENVVISIINEFQKRNIRKL